MPGRASTPEKPLTPDSDTTEATLNGADAEGAIESAPTTNGDGPARAASDEHADGPIGEAQGALDELGRFLTEAGDHLAGLDRLFGEASRPFQELERVLAEAIAAREAALSAANRNAELEAELAQAAEEVESLRESRAHYEESLEAESERRRESEARAGEAQSRLEELERELQEERDRATKLESSLAHAESSIASSVQEANSARKRAEAARLEAEAARLEAEASHEDVESAQMEAEAFLREVDSARGEAERFRLAAQAAFEQMQAVRAEWAPDEDGTPPPWLPESALAGADDADGADATAEANADADAAAEEAESAETTESGRTRRKDTGRTRRKTSTDQSADQKDDGDAAAPEPPPPPEVGGQPAPEDGPVSPLKWSHTAKLALTAAIVECNSSRGLLEAAARVIGSRGGWDAVIAWTVDPRLEGWTRCAMWCVSPEEMESLEAEVKQLRLDDNSAVARAASEGRMSWFADADGTEDPSLTSVCGDGVQSIVMLPLRHEDDTIAVMQLCSRHEGRPSDELFRALQTIGVEVTSTHGALSPEEETPRWTVWRRR